MLLTASQFFRDSSFDSSQRYLRLLLDYQILLSVFAFACLLLVFFTEIIVRFLQLARSSSPLSPSSLSYPISALDRAYRSPPCFFKSLWIFRSIILAFMRLPLLHCSCKLPSPCKLANQYVFLMLIRNYQLVYFHHHCYVRCSLHLF